MIRVKMLRGAGDSLGRSLTAGEEYELDDRDAIILVGMGKAQKVTSADVIDVNQPAVETREPAVQHREPRVRNRGARGQ